MGPNVWMANEELTPQSFALSAFEASCRLRRRLIQNFFGRLKQHYCAIATRYDERARVFLGALYLACSSFGSIDDTA